MARGLIAALLVLLLVAFSIAAYAQSSLEAHAKDLDVRTAIIETRRQLVVDKESSLLALAQELDAQLLREQQAVVVEVVTQAAVPTARTETSALEKELQEIERLRQAQSARQTQLATDQTATQNAAAQAAARRTSALAAQQDATAELAAQQAAADLAAQQAAAQAAELARQQAIAQKAEQPKVTSAS